MNNKKYQDELIKELISTERKIADTMEAVSFLPLEIMDEIGAELYTITKPGELRIDMPYNVVNYSVLRRGLGQDWKYKSRRFHSTLGSWFMEFQHRRLNVKLKIELELVGNLEGESCQLVKVGETIEPVYKLECK